MSADKAALQFPNYFELFQNIVNPFAANAGAGGMANPAAMMMASLDPKEIARKQQELETVLMWLKAQVGVVELSLKTLEYQKSMLEQMASGKAPAAPSPDAAKTAGPSVEELAKMTGAMNPAAWAWNMMQQPVATGETSKKTPRAAAKKTRR